MIGRTEPLRPFDTIRWAREMASASHLRQLDAHLLLVLATYANAEGKAWPGIKTLAIDCGLAVRTRVDPKTGRVSHLSSAVSAALSRLEDAQLIWTTKGSSGRPSTRELLVPARGAVSSVSEEHTDAAVAPTADGLSSVVAEDSDALCSSPTEHLCSSLTEGKYQRERPDTAERPNDERPGAVLRHGGAQPSPPIRSTDDDRPVRDVEDLSNGIGVGQR